MWIYQSNINNIIWNNGSSIHVLLGEESIQPTYMYDHDCEYQYYYFDTMNTQHKYDILRFMSLSFESVYDNNTSN